MIDISGLTGQQKEAFELYKKWLDTPVKIRKKRFVLTGFPGSGKTFLSKTFVDYGIEKGLKVKLLAPTHQAGKVLKNKTGRSVTTTAKGLGIAPNVNIEDYDPANPQFKILKSGEVVGCDVVVQDESSMLSHDIAVLLENEVFTVFVGDPMQLTSIKSIPIKYLKYPDYTLTEVLRTNKQDILDLSTDLRQIDWQTRLKKLKPSGNISIQDKNLFTYNGETVLCYRNVTVGYWNNRLRKHSHLNTEDKYKFYKGVGEWANCEEFIIVSINEQEKFSVAEIKGEDGVADSVNIWKTKYKGDFAELYLGYVEYAKSLFNKHTTKQSSDYYAAWKDFAKWEGENIIEGQGFYYKNQFIPKYFDLAYAMTVHKSQASSIDSVVIDIKDIKGKEKRALLYVAVTRAANKIIFVK